MHHGGWFLRLVVGIALSAGVALAADHSQDIAIIDRALASANPGDHWVKFGGVGIKYTDLQQYRGRLAGSDAESSLQLVDPSAGYQSR